MFSMNLKNTSKPKPISYALTKFMTCVHVIWLQTYFHNADLNFLNDAFFHTMEYVKFFSLMLVGKANLCSRSHYCNREAMSVQTRFWAAAVMSFVGAFSEKKLDLTIFFLKFYNWLSKSLPRFIPFL